MLCTTSMFGCWFHFCEEEPHFPQFVPLDNFSIFPYLFSMHSDFTKTRRVISTIFFAATDENDQQLNSGYVVEAYVFL